MPRRRLGQLGVDHAGLHAGAPVLRIDPEDAVHARQLDDHRAVRQRAAGEAGAGPAGDEGDARRVQGRDDAAQLVGVMDEDDGGRRRPVGGQAVGLEGE